mmetsp:Transcript_4552/g.9659  ORF Transcript_4552/g.9659 Transcript_4552/m.9659 type:complete len:130 (+) Transcript_4552:158-547(+)|eukprot:CAMPEP_0178470148 /NCGR_PEP_ID=MMETSP0696-20121128/376_1 /TAXON_ID=265572 /ORGANISM="Extubocellulus spinifer, Strain CCMP396" /LENGTH=129 /DNA_ID=CAMNT_0020097239 /DNA_START=107 /DNA_END=496 /DNA_ORIENTATION=+
MSNATEIFAAMAEAATNDGKKLRRKFKGSVVFTISDTNERWYLDLKSDAPSAGKLGSNGSNNDDSPLTGSPDLTVKVSEADMIKMVRKELNPQSAFMSGKLKIKGKMALAMKLTSVLSATGKYLPKSKL